MTRLNLTALIAAIGLTVLPGCKFLKQNAEQGGDSDYIATNEAAVTSLSPIEPLSVRERSPIMALPPAVVTLPPVVAVDTRKARHKRFVNKILEVQSVCGDNKLEGDEQCDDGNLVLGDGCSDICEIELCGDGEVDFFEGCDDGNIIAGDGCSPTCILECGDNVIDTDDSDGYSEACDDGGLGSCTPDCAFPFVEGNIIQDNSVVLEVFLGADDTTTGPIPLGFNFPLLGAQTPFSEVFLNSNGSVTFGAGDPNPPTNVADFLNGPPRLAVLFGDIFAADDTDDLYLVSISFFEDRVAVTWLDTDDLSDPDAPLNFLFQLQFNADGKVLFARPVVSTVTFVEPIIVGVTEGLGATDNGERDLNIGDFNSGAGTTVYEFFSGGSDTFDLYQTAQYFTPNGVGGWLMQIFGFAK